VGAPAVVWVGARVGAGGWEGCSDAGVEVGNVREGVVPRLQADKTRERHNTNNVRMRISVVARRERAFLLRDLPPSPIRFFDCRTGKGQSPIII
ncbi:MAG TPA: hypothetical protein VIV15_16215, partial [Anaerolineales bacterium]